ncbi:hypothetical protein Bca4012_054601 [Brassica carinata]
MLLVTMHYEQTLVITRGYRVQLKQADFSIWHRWRTRRCVPSECGVAAALFTACGDARNCRARVCRALGKAILCRA